MPSRVCSLAGKRDNTEIHVKLPLHVTPGSIPVSYYIYTFLCKFNEHAEQFFLKKTTKKRTIEIGR